MLLSAAAALTAARPAFAQSKGKIVYMIPTLLDEFQTESQKAVESVFTSLGYEVTSIDAQNDASRQLSQLEDMINTKPDAVIMNAVAFDSIVPGIEKARAAGIKVLNFDRLITTTEFDLTSVAGTVEIGEIAANEAIRLLTERHGSAKGKVLQILGDPGDAYTLDIQKGFEAVMAEKAPEVEIISKAALLWEPTNAGRAFEDQLLVTQDIDLVFAHAAHLTVPIVSIMEAKGMKPGDMMLMASNGAPVGLDNIRAGWQQVEVEQPTYAQVYGLAMFIDKIMAGEKLEPGTYDVIGLKATLTDEDWGPNLKIPGAAITKENVDDPRFWGNLKFPSVPVDVVK
ncbi:sugar ABC transporter substrate-binding protein [Geminicoccus roseus]|uniref:sugar ABC transporter substrate-binding protein n=1 Tax=Geminicoccus roseus TaxID=404900 RepID=UPI0004010DC5|nr:sugar ABC transporter substrate-binding protein [Geminicoccus roseus]